MTSLLEQPPKIGADGKREAERVMEHLESNYRVGFQTRELVIPSRDTNWQDITGLPLNTFPQKNNGRQFRVQQ